MPSASLNRRISWPTMPSEIGSSPANGSSYINSIGSGGAPAGGPNAPRHSPGQLRGHETRRAPQADRVQLHEHEIADQLFGKISVLAQRERDVFVHGHVGEKRAE